MQKITFLGLGAMGSRMAHNLLESGFPLTVWNRDHRKTQILVDKGARAASTPRAAVAEADIVMSMVRDDAAAQDVWLDSHHGALAGMPANAIAIENSTLTPAMIRTLAETATKRHIHFLDAPVLGSRPQAEARQLIYLVGGESEALETVKPVLMMLGHAVHSTGATGTGATLKLAINALFGVQVAAVAEILGTLAQQGITEETASTIIGSTPVASPAVKAAMASMLADNYNPLFPIELVEKDFVYMEALAATPLISAAHAVFHTAAQSGLAGEHITAVRKQYTHRVSRLPLATHCP